MICTKTKGNLLSTVTKVTKDRRDPMSSVILVMSWNQDLLDVDHRTHDNWVVSFTTWSCRSPSYGRAKTCRNQTKIRDQNPALGYICPGELHQRSPNAPKIEDRSQEETEWQERGAREAAWSLAKSVLKFKEHERATFFSRKIGACLHQLSNLRNENLLSTPARQCTWSAKRTWVMLKWILWRSRVVPR